MLTYITHLVDCSWFENKSILTYITHRVFMLQMLQSMLTYLAHNKICGYRFLIVIYLSPNIYTVICVPKLLQIYNLKSHFKHTCWHTWCRISKWACVPKLEQKSLYSPPRRSWSWWRRRESGGRGSAVAVTWIRGSQRESGEVNLN